MRCSSTFQKTLFAIFVFFLLCVVFGTRLYNTLVDSGNGALLRLRASHATHIVPKIASSTVGAHMHTTYGGIERGIQNIEKKDEDNDNRNSRSLKKKPLRNIFYMHVPKCGSSFATLIVQYACPTFPKNVTVKEPGDLMYPPGVELDRKKYCGDAFRRFDSGHYPLPKVQDSVDIFMEKNDVVTFLRDPLNRTISAFLDNFHSCNMSTMARKYAWLYPNIRNPARVMGAPPNYTRLFLESHSDSLVDIVKYYWTCVQGCATRMIVGEWCGNILDQEPMTVAKVHAAVARLQKFAFIGITDRWNDSVNLWRHLFGGHYSKSVYKNTRPSKHKKYEGIILDIIRKHHLIDEADTIMYLFAQERMNQLLDV